MTEDFLSLGVNIFLGLCLHLAAKKTTLDFKKKPKNVKV